MRTPRYNYGEAELKDLSEPCIRGQFLNLRSCKAENPCSSAEQCLTGLIDTSISPLNFCYYRTLAKLSPS